MSGRPLIPHSLARRDFLPYALIAVAGAIFFFHLGTGALTDWDEAIYAEVAKEIVRGHHWLTLYWQHRPFFEKPPLAIWVEAIFFKWFGISEFSARLESAVAGTATVALTWAIGRRMYGAFPGLLAGFILLASSGYDSYARQGMTDVALCLWIYLALYAYLRLQKGSPAWFFGICAAVGLGAMVKGPAVLIAPFAIVVSLLLGEQEKLTIGYRHFCLGGLLLLAIIVPWHWWMVSHYGDEFINSYFGFQIFTRATRVIEGHYGKSYYYLRAIAYGAFPWSVVGIFAFLKWLRRPRQQESVAWGLICVTLLIYTLVPTKLEQYALPIYPALAIETAAFLASISESRRWIRPLTAAAVISMICIILVRTNDEKGDPLANNMAQLATISRSYGQAHPLIIIGKQGAGEELGEPTAVFYSERSTKLFEMPGEMKRFDEFMKNRADSDCIVQAEALGDVSQRYTVRTLAHNGLLAYSRIYQRVSP